MAKVTLDRDAFKALASDTRLDILRTLDGKKMTVTELSNETKMNKATLHEHLNKLQTVGLIKRLEREGHKWVYYKLSWKGSSLLHPENNRIVVMFSATFLVLITAIASIGTYLTTQVQEVIPPGVWDTFEESAQTKNADDGMLLLGGERSTELAATQPYFLYIAVACIILFTILFFISYRRYKANKQVRI